MLFRDDFIKNNNKKLLGRVVFVRNPYFDVLTLVLFSLILVFILFLCFSSYSRKEVVSGWLVPKGGIIRVTARSGGVVERLLVKEGDFVRVGQPIAQIRLSTALTNGVDTATEAGAAISAEADAVAVQAAANKNKLLSEKVSIWPKIGRLEQQLAQTRGQIIDQRKRVDIADADVARFKVLADDHIVATRLVDDRRAALLTEQQELSKLQISSVVLRQQIADAKNRLVAITSELASSEAGAQISGAELRQKVIQNSAQNLDVAVASVSGRVLAIPVEQGQSLTSGGAVAIIAPKGARLEAVLYAPSRVMGFVRPGQDVHLMYQAFPHEKFGAQRGRILSISKTVLSPSEIQVPGIDLKQPVFRVRALVLDQGIYAYGQYVPLQPGMQLSASIIFDRRSLFQWLFDPIYAVRK